MQDNYLAHYGILGQKWGIRRYQNPDGTLTEEGRKRYGRETGKELTEEGKKKLVDDYIKQKNRGFGDHDGQKARNIATVISDLVEADEDFKRNADNPNYENLLKASEKATKKVLGDAGNKLVYKDERDSQVWKLIGEAIAAEYLIKNSVYRSKDHQAQGNTDNVLGDKPRSKWRSWDAPKITDEQLRARVQRLQQESMYRQNIKAIDSYIENNKKDHPGFAKLIAESSARGMSEVAQALTKSTLQNAVAAFVVNHDKLDESWTKYAARRNELFPKKK